MSIMTMGADFDQLPWRRAYRGHRDDIVPIACASATPARHSRNKSPLRRSTPKPKLPTSGMFPFFWNVPPMLFHLVVVTTSRQPPLKLLSDEDEVCATWCLKIGRRARKRAPRERRNLLVRESNPAGDVNPCSSRQAASSCKRIMIEHVDAPRVIKTSPTHSRARLLAIADDIDESSVVIRSTMRLFHRGKVERLA